MTTDYETFVLRNRGYIDPELQQRIRLCRLLVAGCGIGSAIAEAAARIGFERITLVDGDVVEAHNLNRQNYVAADVGRKKVDALADRLKAINPGGDFRAVDAWVDLENAAAFVRDADVLIETIDILALPAIVALHDAGAEQGSPIISAASAGFGAVALYFPPGATCTFRDLFDIPRGADVSNMTGMERFGTFLKRVGQAFSPEVRDVIRNALSLMNGDVPCPASHLSVSSAAIASLCVTAAVRHLAGLPCDAAPRMLTVDMAGVCTSSVVDLLP